MLTLAGPFTPMLFMGEEWGATTPWQFFTSHPEPDLGRATAEGRIAEFARMGWDPDVVPDPQDPHTFRAVEARLVRTAARRARAAARPLPRPRRTAPHRARADRPPLLRACSAEFDDDTGWFRLDRGGISVLANFGEDQLALPQGAVVLLSTSGVTDALAADSAAIVRRPID